MEIVRWCSGCSAEQAVITIEAEINGEWTDIDVGSQCLTRLGMDDSVGKQAGVAQSGEHVPVKDEVAGSKPVTRA